MDANDLQRALFHSYDPRSLLLCLVFTGQLFLFSFFLFFLISQHRFCPLFCCLFPLSLSCEFSLALFTFPRTPGLFYIHFPLYFCRAPLFLSATTLKTLSEKLLALTVGNHLCCTLLESYFEIWKMCYSSTSFPCYCLLLSPIYLFIYLVSLCVCAYFLFVSFVLLQFSLIYSLLWVWIEVSLLLFTSGFTALRKPLPFFSLLITPLDLTVSCVLNPSSSRPKHVTSQFSTVIHCHMAAGLRLGITE